MSQSLILRYNWQLTSSTKVLHCFPNFTFFLLLFCYSALLLHSFIHLFHALSFPSSPAPRHLSSPTPPLYTVTDRPILAPTHKMENTHQLQAHTPRHTGCANAYTSLLILTLLTHTCRTCYRCVCISCSCHSDNVILNMRPLFVIQTTRPCHFQYSTVPL